MLKRDVCPSNFNWNIWNWNAQLVFLPFLYKALHCPKRFVIYSEGKTQRNLPFCVKKIKATLERWLLNGVVSIYRAATYLCSVARTAPGAA